MVNDYNLDFSTAKILYTHVQSDQYSLTDPFISIKKLIAKGFGDTLYQFEASISTYV